MGKKPYVKNINKGDFYLETKTISCIAILKDLNFRNALIYEVR